MAQRLFPRQTLRVISHPSLVGALILVLVIHCCSLFAIEDAEVTEMQRTSDLYAILLNRNTLQVLLLIDESGNWTLPHVHIPDKRLWPAMAGIISGEMQKLLGADVTVLRRVFSQYSADRSHVDLIHELENHSVDWMLPPKAKWVDELTLKSLSLSRPEHRAVIEEELQAAKMNQIPDVRPLWAQAGWFQVASAWMREQLTHHNYVLTSPTVQVKSWGISCILKTSTNRGDIYFKVASSLPLFGNEPKVQQAISKHYPDCVPAPIAIEPEQRWMLMQDFGAELRDMPTLERWVTATRRFGELQVQAVPLVDELLAAGCLDRRLNVLSEQIDPLLNDEEIVALLSAEEIAQLRALAPRLKTMCDELAGFNVPYSLNHGDLHSGNITGETLQFFDWTDACIAHPFLDLSTVVSEVEQTALEGRESVLEIYLNLWTAYEPIEHLRVMGQLAYPLGVLHQAVSYQHILAALEPTSKPEMSDGLRYWLRRVIHTMSQ